MCLSFFICGKMELDFMAFLMALLKHSMSPQLGRVCVCGREMPDNLNSYKNKILICSRTSSQQTSSCQILKHFKNALGEVSQICSSYMTIEAHSVPSCEYCEKLCSLNKYRMKLSGFQNICSPFPSLFICDSFCKVCATVMFLKIIFQN